MSPGFDFGREAADPSFEVDFDVRLGDAVHAGLWQLVRRAPAAVAAYGAAAIGSSAFALVTGTLAWLAILVWGLGAAILCGMAWTARTALGRSAGPAGRMRAHVCASGVEVGGPRGSDWIAWDDLWEAAETSRSFLLCPSPSEQYVIPKRCCGEPAATLLRRALAKAGAGAPQP